MPEGTTISQLFVHLHGPLGVGGQEGTKFAAVGIPPRAVVLQCVQV